MSQLCKNETYGLANVLNNIKMGNRVGGPTRGYLPEKRGKNGAGKLRARHTMIYRANSMRLQGVQGSGFRTEEERSGPYASRKPPALEHSLLAEDEPPGSAEQNYYGLWGTLFDSAEQEACLVVMSIGGRWPSWLSDELPGKSSSMIVVQQPSETVLSLAARARKLVSETTSPVRTVIWLRDSTEVDDTWALELVSDLDDLLPPDCRVRVSGGYDSAYESLSPERQNQENQPLACRQMQICEDSVDTDSFVA